MKKRTAIIILLFALTCQVSASTILWDASHGEHGYVPGKWFRALSNHLAGYGFGIDTTYNGFLVDDPALYDIVVVCVGSSMNSAYITEEVEKIKGFVVNGGGLLIMGEMDSSGIDNIQPVASAFGITLGVSNIGSYPWAIYTSDFAPHPLFDGIDEICFQSVGELSTSSNLEEVAWYEGTDKSLVVAGEYGYGRVVALGDINIFSSFNGSGEYYDRADNRQFSVNTFEYLISAPEIEVSVDIKPGSCPNPVNVKSKGVLPVAILGSEDVNVMDIDPASIAFSIGEVSVGSIRSSYEDVAAPVSDTSDCNCIEAGPDGFLDLTLKFETQKIVEAIGDVDHGDILTLGLTGVLFGEIPIAGADCILIKGKHRARNKADINEDGVVDTADFAIRTENRLQSNMQDKAALRSGAKKEMWEARMKNENFGCDNLTKD